MWPLFLYALSMNSTPYSTSGGSYFVTPFQYGFPSLEYSDTLDNNTNNTLLYTLHAVSYNTTQTRRRSTSPRSLTST